MLHTRHYLEQKDVWPAAGRQLLAQFDADSVIVYQAYRREIGEPAALTGRFGAGWSRSRMSWVKPGFLWMMYRSGWASKPEQEVVLAIRILRSGFEEALAAAVPSSFDPRAHVSREQWASEVVTSDARLQWDPDHDPFGKPLERRALQLGLRGDLLARFADQWITSIEDVSGFVREQRERLQTDGVGALVTPVEESYPLGAALAKRLGVG